MKYIIMVSLLLLGGSVYPFVRGYERLYNPQTNVIIDILYDTHMPERTLSARDMDRLSFSQIKRQLFQTEQRVLDALDLINRRAPEMVDVIWEDGLRDSLALSTVFLNCSQKLVRNQFRNLNVIASDTCRAVFERFLFTASDDSEKEVTDTLGMHLMPVSDEDIITLLSHYGDGTWDAFDQLRTQTVTGLVDRYRQNYYLTTLKLTGDEYYNTLTNCEMLRNILTSHKPRIILYSGGWHSRRISEFLRHYAGFNRIGGKVNDLFDEIDVKDLASLDDAFRSAV
jgi:hypothetical protein